MADSKYKQILDLVATDAQSLADPILVPDGTVHISRLQTDHDWETIRGERGIHVCWNEEIVEIDHEGTNERDMRAYPVHVVYCGRWERQWGEREDKIEKFKTNVRRFYNYQRKANPVVDAGSNEIQCRVLESGPRPPRNVDWQDYDVHSLTIMCWFIEPRLD